jgi:hypothetical protein
MKETLRRRKQHKRVHHSLMLSLTLELRVVKGNLWEGLFFNAFPFHL